MKIAIVDDEVLYCSLIKDIISSEFLEDDIHVFNDGNAYLQSNNQYDITILDIHMPKIDGIKLSRQIERKTKLIIFVTSMKERMQEAFGLNVYAFILKEELNNKLRAIIKNAVEKLNNSLLDFSTKTQDILVYINDIYYIQIENRKLYLYTKNEIYKINKQPLSNIKKILNGDFVYVSQSCLLNIKHIKIREKNQLILKNDSVLPISRKYQKEFKLNYMRSILNE